MRFKAKKVYGQSKITRCPFCDKLATRKSEQGLDVCPQHTKSALEEIKCTCGSWLEQRVGKFGPYFNCLKCGNINYNKAMEIKEITMKDKPKNVIIDKPTKNEVYGGSKNPKDFSEPKPTFSRTSSYSNKKERKEITITSDDVEYFD
jgi:hypothetical protein